MPPQVQITWQRERAKKGSDLVIFYSEGGEAFLRSQDEVWSEAAQVKANDEQVSALMVVHGKTGGSPLLPLLARLNCHDKRRRDHALTTQALDKLPQ